MKTVCDVRSERLAVVERTYPGIETTSNVEDIFNDNDIDAVCIATPVYLHYELAKKSLESGKSVLVEKPMTATSAEASDLIEIASKKGF